MPRSRSHPRPRTAAPTKVVSVQNLRRRLACLAAERTAESQRHARSLSALRRSHDRRVASLVAEIAQLRHHEARNQVLTRSLAEREAAVEAQKRRISELESLLQKATEIR